MTKKTAKRKKKRIPQPSSPKDLARAMFAAADQKLKKKAGKKD